MIFISNGIKKLTGLEENSFISEGQSIMSFIESEDIQRIKDAIEQSAQRQRPFEIEYRIRDCNDARKWVFEKGLPVYNKDTETITFQGVIIDITTQKETAAELLSRDKLLEGSSEAFKELIAIPDFHEALLKAMRLLRLSADVDKSFVFKHFESENGQMVLNHIAEWDRYLLEPVSRPDMQGISYLDISPSWYYSFCDGKEVIADIENAEEKERDFLQIMNIYSALILPVFVSKKLWGIIGLGMAYRGGKWSTSHKAIFKAIVGTLGIVITRNQDALDLQTEK
jgi:PAS domain S-box-containing protein